MEVGALLSEILTNGLGDIEGGEAAREMMRRQERDHEAQRRAETKIVREALETEAGRQFVQWLAAKTLLRGENEAELGATTCEAYAIAKAKRQGQNQVFLMIVDALQQGRAAAPEKRQRRRKGSVQ